MFGQDGFIAGIDYYCDRWCETCDFTSRCRSFTQMTDLEARQDRSMTPVITAAFAAAPPIHPAVAEAIRAGGQRPVYREREPVRDCDEEIPREHQRLLARVEAYAFHAAASLPEADLSPPFQNAVTVIARYRFFASAKIYRALTGVARPYLADSIDADGSAKAALVALERSHAAWLALIAAKLVSAVGGEALVSDLVWLRVEIERIFPNAPAFIRPGFDEPRVTSSGDAH